MEKLSTDFTAVLNHRATEVEMALTGLLDQRLRTGEIARPERLLAAMRHGVLNGGKRLRPFSLSKVPLCSAKVATLFCVLLPHSNAFTAIRLSMTTCQLWTMMISGAVSRPCTRHLMKPPPFWRVTAFDLCFRHYRVR